MQFSNFNTHSHQNFKTEGKINVNSHAYNHNSGNEEHVTILTVTALPVYITYHAQWLQCIIHVAQASTWNYLL